MDILTITQIDNNGKNVSLNVSGHTIYLKSNEQTKHLARGQKIVLVYDNVDGRPLMCVCGWRAYFLDAPLRMSAHQTNVCPNASHFAGIRNNSLDKALFRLVKLRQRLGSHKR